MREKQNEDNIAPPHELCGLTFLKNTATANTVVIKKLGIREAATTDNTHHS
jgi:hypothetical protein